MDNKLPDIRQLLSAQGLDGMLISTPANITYLTGFDFLAPNEREAFVFITKSSQYVISSFLYRDEIKKIAPAFTFLDIAENGHTPFWQHIKNLLQEEDLKKIGFEKYNLTFAEYNALYQKNVPLQPIVLDGIRAVKSFEETQHIQMACTIGDTAFKAVLKFIKPGMTEKEVAFLLETEMRKQGAEPSFPSIIAFGKNAAVPHHKTNQTKLQKKDIILMDFGVKYANYCSDMSRTIFMGTPTGAEEKVYQTVKTAQDKAFSFLSSHRTPIAAAETDKVARDYIIEQGFPNFPHSLGHSIGIEVHDGFGLSPASPTQLIEGMVFSIEPGIYIPDELGVRIEDLVVLTAQGPQLLTNAPRELIVL